MCDCYDHKCENCDATISIHIADFCTPRYNITVFCPACTNKHPLARTAKKEGRRPRPNYPAILTMGPKGQPEMWLETVEGASQVRASSGEVVGRKGQVVLISCYDPNAYGIHLN